MTDGRPRIVGLGHAVPEQVRGNDAPIFDWLKSHPQYGNKLFEGYKERRVLADGEDLMTVMVPAAQQAIETSGLVPDDIDLLLGCGSVSPFATPNELGHLHQKLGLPARTWVLPLNNEFSNFNAGLLLADGLIRAGRARNVLVVNGGAWTRYVNYHTPQSISAGDGAGAAVIGVQGGDPLAQWEIVDHCTITQSEYFGSMFMQGDRVSSSAAGGTADAPGLWTDPYFHITERGIEGFKEFAVKVAPTAVTTLLQRHGLSGANAALIAHQASAVLLEAWQQVIQPKQFVQTITEFANMTVANIPVTLSWSRVNAPVTTEYLVLFALGVEMHANALLLRRCRATDMPLAD